MRRLVYIAVSNVLKDVQADTSVNPELKRKAKLADYLINNAEHIKEVSEGDKYK